MNFLNSKIPRNKSLFLTYMKALSFGRHVHALSHTQKLRNSSVLYHKTKNPGLIQREPKISVGSIV